MKTHFFKPGFELIFSVSLIAILGLPPMLMAQNQKDLDIKISNGDTTVNGKNIRGLSAAERKDALSDIRHMSGADNGATTFSFRRRDTLGGRIKRIEIRKRTGNSMFGDSITRVEQYSTGRNGNSNPRMTFRYRFNDNGVDGGDLNNRNFGDGINIPMTRFERRNSQNFHYINIDKDGISTHVSFEVSEVSNDDLKRMPYVEGGKFEIIDLNLVPEFSTGKTLLMFNLPVKTTAEVKLTDDEGKVLWTEKAIGGSFKKAFVFGLNGVYFLQISQGHNVSIKKIIKEE
jgi:hypothetical protein